MTFLYFLSLPWRTVDECKERTKLQYAPAQALRFASGTIWSSAIIALINLFL